MTQMKLPLFKKRVSFTRIYEEVVDFIQRAVGAVQIDKEMFKYSVWNKNRLFLAMERQLLILEKAESTGDCIDENASAYRTARKMISMVRTDHFLEEVSCYYSSDIVFIENSSTPKTYKMVEMVQVDNLDKYFEKHKAKHRLVEKKCPTCSRHTKAYMISDMLMRQAKRIAFYNIEKVEF